VQYNPQGIQTRSLLSQSRPKTNVNRRPTMKAKILTFSSHCDTTLLEYDPATANMEEVNEVIAEYEAKTGAQPFDMATGERIEKSRASRMKS
jgi:hypothetical protein